MAQGQVTKLKRRTTGPGSPPTLEPGEMAYNTTGHTIVIGDATSTVVPLVGANRQVELAGPQTITGQKTIAAANLKVTGGQPNTLLATDGFGNLSFVPPPSPPAASDAEMDAGVVNTTYGTPKNIRSLVGASVTTLTTAAKTLVPAINEVKAALNSISAGQTFVGSFNATASSIRWTAASGASGNTLPAPAPINRGWYLIAEVGGSAPPAGAPAGTYNNGDWLISDGSAWTHLALGGSTTSNASSIAVTPPVAGGSNVQTSLQGLDAGKVDLAGDTMQGVLVLAGNPVAPLDAVTKQYVDSKNADQDLALGAKVNVAGDTMAGSLILSTALPTIALESAAKGYVDAQRDTRVAKAGDTMAGILKLAADPAAPLDAATKQYVDQRSGSVSVTGPELAGTGLAASPVTFTGISHEAATFGGTGLSGAPLTLLVVDGGSY
jgi:hypothetical protein